MSESKATAVHRLLKELRHTTRASTPSRKSAGTSTTPSAAFLAFRKHRISSARSTTSRVARRLSNRRHNKHTVDTGMEVHTDRVTRPGRVVPHLGCQMHFPAALDVAEVDLEEHLGDESCLRVRGSNRNPATLGLHLPPSLQHLQRHRFRALGRARHRATTVANALTVHTAITDTITVKATTHRSRLLLDRPPADSMEDTTHRMVVRRRSLVARDSKDLVDLEASHSPMPTRLRRLLDLRLLVGDSMARLLELHLAGSHLPGLLLVGAADHYHRHCDCGYELTVLDWMRLLGLFTRRTSVRIISVYKAKDKVCIPTHVTALLKSPFSRIYWLAIFTSFSLFAADERDLIQASPSDARSSLSDFSRPSPLPSNLCFRQATPQLTNC